MTDAINKENVSLPYLARKWGIIEAALVADWKERCRENVATENTLASAAGGAIDTTPRDYWSEELIMAIDDGNAGLREMLLKVYRRRQQESAELTQLLAEVAILRELK